LNQFGDVHSFAESFQLVKSHSVQGKGQFILNTYTVGRKLGHFYKFITLANDDTERQFYISASVRFFI